MVLFLACASYSMRDRPKPGSGTRGPITEKLQSIYFEAVRGEQSQYAEWLAPVAD